MSQVEATELENEVIKCHFCGSKQRKCPECGEMFHMTKDNHHICRDRCRTRRLRKKKRIFELKKLGVLSDNEV